MSCCTVEQSTPKTICFSRDTYPGQAPESKIDAISEKITLKFAQSIRFAAAYLGMNI